MADLATSTPSGLPEEEETTFELPEEEPIEEPIEEVVMVKTDIALPTLSLPTTLAELENYDVEKVFESLDTEQEEYKAYNKKYKQKVRENNTEVHEYVCPNGEVGYQVFVYTEIDGKKMVKSFGKGQESVARTFDWREVEEAEEIIEKEIIKEIKK